MILRICSSNCRSCRSSTRFSSQVWFDRWATIAKPRCGEFMCSQDIWRFAHTKNTQRISQAVYIELAGAHIRPKFCSVPNRNQGRQSVHKITQSLLSRDQQKKVHPQSKIVRESKKRRGWISISPVFIKNGRVPLIISGYRGMNCNGRLGHDCPLYIYSFKPFKCKWLHAQSAFLLRSLRL